MGFLRVRGTVGVGARLSSGSLALMLAIAGMWSALGSVAVQAHEVVPAISDLTIADGVLTLSVTMPVEGPIAGINLGTVFDTNDAPQAADYDALRAMPPDALAARFNAFWPGMAQNFTILADGVRITPDLTSFTGADVGDVGLPRQSVFELTAALPPEARSVQIGWAPAYGSLVVRQMGVDKPYDGYLTEGALSDPIAIEGGGQFGQWQTFFRYIPIGFDHIVPKGLDHILFVLGLFFLALRIRPLLTQVTAFTVAHTVSLALGALGIVNVPANIVEPIIAASIVYVAVENILSPQMSRWRPAVVFGFGLLHGLGFAGCARPIGLPEGAFIPALIGFNLGVEFGQLTVIAVAFALVGYWFRDKSWYRARIAVPASVFIALVGAWWVVQRTLLA